MSAERPAPIESTADEQQTAFLAHLLGFFLIVPLVIWLTKKEKSPFVDDQAKEAINFQFAFILGFIVLSFISFVPVIRIVAWLLQLGLLITDIAFCYMASQAAKRGEVYRYPFALRLI